MQHHVPTVAIDLAKQVFHLVGSDTTGTILWRKRLTRHALMPFIAQLPAVTIGMEACGGAHYWARRFRSQGHTVKLLAPQFVKPYVQSTKNDMRDAEAMGEAMTRPTMRFVPIKAVEQQDIQALHRVRERLIKARTALVNEMRGLLHEYGLILPQGVSKFRTAFLHQLETEQAKLTSLSQELCKKLFDEFGQLEEPLSYYKEKIEALAHQHPECQRLQTIPGLGPLTATALIAAVHDPSVFANGRQCAAWLGLVPRQQTTGGKDRLLGISKRGDSYLRKLLIHGARATMRWVGTRTDRRSQWIRELVTRRGKNRAAVAIANKNARIVWVLLRRSESYRPIAGKAQV